MSGWEVDARTVLTVLVTLPLVAVVVFALVDVLWRSDLPPARRVLYAAVIALVLPATILYLLSRPTSIVRHREREVHDDRDELLDRLEQRAGAPPVVGPRHEALLRERVEALRG